MGHIVGVSHRARLWCFRSVRTRGDIRRQRRCVRRRRRQRGGGNHCSLGLASRRTRWDARRRRGDFVWLESEAWRAASSRGRHPSTFRGFWYRSHLFGSLWGPTGAGLQAESQGPYQIHDLEVGRGRGSVGYHIKGCYWRVHICKSSPVLSPRLMLYARPLTVLSPVGSVS